MNENRKRLLADGLAAGLIGYAVVVVFFAVWNLAMGRSPFHTAALLGSAIFGGLRDAGAVTIDPAMVLSFNGLHILAFIAYGFFAAWLVYETELHPEFWYLTFFLFIVAGVVSYAAILAVTMLVETEIAPWLVMGGSLLSALGMAGYLAGSHRRLVGDIRREGVGRLGTVD